MKRLFFKTMLVTILISKGDCQCIAKTCRCGPKSLSVSQEETGKVYNFSYIEYKVTVTNQCDCGGLSQIILGCSEFESYTSMNPAIFSRKNELCNLLNGSPLSAKASVTITYAWTRQWELTPLFCQATC